MVNFLIRQLRPLLVSAGVFAVASRLLPASTRILAFHVGGVLTAWIALIALEELRRARWPILRSTEFAAILAFGFGVTLALALQSKIAGEIWLEPTLVLFAVCVLTSLVLSRITAVGSNPASDSDQVVRIWTYAAILSLTLWAASRIQEGAPVPLWYVGAVTTTWLLFARLIRLGALSPRRTVRETLVRFTAIHLGAFLTVSIVGRAFGDRMPPSSLAGLFMVSLATLAGFHLVQRRLERSCADGPGESLRLVTLLFGCAFLLHPLLTFHAVGAGDAIWYATMLRDAVEQFHAGQFPVYVGQSQFAFNGAVFPFMLAPYFLYLGGLLDLITFHSLGIFALQHLTVTVSLTGGVVILYHCVRQFVPIHPCLAVGIALIFGASPGVLAPLYTSDMYLTAMTLPWVPLAVYCAYRVAANPGRTAWVGLGASVGILCWSHIPVAIWTGLACAVPVALRFAFGPDRRAVLKNAVLAMVVFALTSIGYFVPILATLDNSLVAPAIAAMMRNLQSAVPGAFLSVSDPATLLSDFQLGYSLWILLLWGALDCWGRPRMGPASGLVLSSLGILTLVLPIPHLTASFWKLLPDHLVLATDIWPMQRLYLLLGAISCLLGAAALRRSASRSTGIWILRCGIGFMVIWSGTESTKFLQRGNDVRHLKPAASSAALEINSLLTLNSFAPFFPRHSPPHYFSNGTVNPALANRLLEASDLSPILTGRKLPPPEKTYVLRAKMHPLWPVIVGLDPAIILPPHSRWLVHFRFPQHNFAGRFHLQGHWIDRQYPVPAAINAQPLPSFLSRTMVLWNDQDEPEAISLRYYPDPNSPLPSTSDDPTADVSIFAEVQLTRYTPDIQQIEILSFIPLRLQLNASNQAFLESFRLWIPGYQAQVNGRPVVPQKSPDGLIMIPISRGENTVTLEFRGPWFVRYSTWISLASAVLIGMWAFLRWHRCPSSTFNRPPTPV